MSQLVARIMLAIFMIPLALMVFFLTLFIAYELANVRSDEVVLLASTIVTWFFVAAYWTTLWVNSVRWTGPRRQATAFASIGSFFVGAALGVIIGLAEDEVGWFVAGVLVPLLWLVWTTLVWRETKAERAERIRNAGRGGITCPTCGYNLTGLSESRCPECGTRYTLDELLAAQPEHAAAEIEA